MPELQLRNIYDTIRIPLVEGTQHVSQANGSPYTVDEFMLNCFPQSSINPITGEKETWITKRPGMKALGIDLTGILGAVNSQVFANIAITALNDVYIAGVLDITNGKMVIIQYRPITGTSTKLGEITTATYEDQLFLTELTVAGVPTLGVVWNRYDGVTSKGYYATSTAGVFLAASLTEITDVDFPPKAASPLPLVGPMVQMNGTTYVLTNTGEIHGSDLNSITSWNSLNMVQAISFPDQGTGLFRYKNYILAFGENSIEWFSDVGNPAPASALQRQEQAMIRFGAPHAKSVQVVDDTVFWLGRSTSGTSGLWKMDGFEPVKVSGPVEDQLINFYSSNSNLGNFWQLLPMTMLGQKQLMIGGVHWNSGFGEAVLASGDPHNLAQSQGGVLCLNIPEQKFWFYEPYIDTSECVVGMTPMCVTANRLTNVESTIQYCMLSTYAGVGNFGAYIWQFDGTLPRWSDQNRAGTQKCYAVAYQPNRVMFNNAKKKRIHKFLAIFDFMQSEAVDPETGAYLWFYWEKDRWNAEDASDIKARSISIPNTFGRYYVTNLGAARTWGLGVASANAMSMRLRALELDVSQGTQ